MKIRSPTFKQMPQFWIAIFFIFLAVAQLYESVKEIELPLPVYLLLGTILAIASNSHQKSSVSPDPYNQPLTATAKPRNLD